MGRPSGPDPGPQVDLNHSSQALDVAQDPQSLDVVTQPITAGVPFDC